jgi:drug/metabolite transporter (DMT)-like permease
VTAVLFGLLGGALFGALSVGIQYGLRRGGDPEVGALVTAVTALGVTGILALAEWGDVRPNELWPFLVAGFLVPGASQILFVKAVRDAGPSRASILVGTAPLMSVLLALVVLDEPWKTELLGGTVLVVAGGAALTRERIRPEHFRALGVALALTCAMLFASRDILVRWAAREEHPPPLLAAATSLLAASVGVSLYLLVFRRRGFMPKLRITAQAFAPAGVALGLAYACLLEAFDRGKVTVVAPLNATQSLWAVLLSVLLFRRTELIGRRVVAAALLVVAGGALIGVFR